MLIAVSTVAGQQKICNFVYRLCEVEMDKIVKE